VRVFEIIREDAFQDFLARDLSDIGGGKGILGALTGNKDDASTGASPDASSGSNTKISVGNTPNDSGGMPVNGTVTSKFGWRMRGHHNGVDIAVPVGTPVKSPLSGVVSKTGSDNMNGNFVAVKNGNEENLFLHLSKINVSNGQQVKKGDVIGLSGSTGHSTGPHLHWEKRVAGNAVDPMTTA